MKKNLDPVVQKAWEPDPFFLSIPISVCHRIGVLHMVCCLRAIIQIRILVWMYTFLKHVDWKMHLYA